MSLRVDVNAVVEGMEMQSDEMHSYLHRPTGRIVTVSDDALAAAENGDEDCDIPEELPEARRIVAAQDEYLELPDRFEINEYRMMERFAESLADGSACDAALRALHRRGAFRYFKDTVHSLGVAKSWYAFRDECYWQVAREWCDANGIECDDSPHPELGR